MTDQNIVDFTAAHKPWRQGLPEYYVAQIDRLKEDCETVCEIRRRWEKVRAQFSEASSEATERCTRAVAVGHLAEHFAAADAAYLAERLTEDIGAVIVLLQCAETRMRTALPLEELMSRAELKELGQI